MTNAHAKNAPGAQRETAAEAPPRAAGETPHESSSSAVRAAALTPHDRARAVVAAIAEKHGVTVAEIMGPRGRREVSTARLAAYAAMKRAFPAWSLPQIARFFDRDHSTILVGIERAKQLGVD